MEIEWMPVYSRIQNRTLEMQSTLKDSSTIEIWSYRIDLGIKYYFKILKFQIVDGISIKKRIEHSLDFVDGFDSLEDCQNFIEKNLKKL